MKTNESVVKPSSPMVLEPSSNIKSQCGIINPQEIFDRVQAANPAIKLKFISIWDDGEISAQARDSEWMSANSVEEICKKFSAIATKTEADKIREELLSAENKANELRARLAELSKCEKE
jgi:hypothetical protein